MIMEFMVCFSLGEDFHEPQIDHTLHIRADHGVGDCILGIGGVHNRLFIPGHHCCSPYEAVTYQ